MQFYAFYTYIFINVAVMLYTTMHLILFIRPLS